MISCKDPSSVTYSVHAADHSIIYRRLVFGGDQEAVTLSSRNINHFSLGRISIDTVDLNYSHVVTFEPKVLTSKCTNVDDPEEIGFARLNSDGKVLSVVHKSCLWDRLGTSRIGFVEELWNQNLHLLVIPVRERYDDLFVHLVCVRGVGISDNKWCTKTIGVLSFIVRVIPVGPGLIDLDQFSQILIA